jgi:hypothetical protein
MTLLKPGLIDTVPVADPALERAKEHPESARP